jgi:CarD family transcriptional regulator
MWSRRAQEYDQKINSGKIYELAEVVRDLNKKTDVIAEQSYSERQLFEKAYERLKSEFQVVLKEKAQIKMDKALKREINYEAETKIVTKEIQA